MQQPESHEENQDMMSQKPREAYFKSGQVLDAAERPKEEDRISVGYRNMEFLGGLSKSSFGDRMVAVARLDWFE